MTHTNTPNIAVIKLTKEEGSMQKSNQEKWILYSTCDEDSFSELRALDITSNDRVLSVTGSGCRTLSLLACNPKSLTSVDFSPGQNYLLELKLAAIRALSYDKLLKFFGVEDSRNRWDTFCSFEEQISPQASAYFKANRWAIDKGILFTGRHELFYVRFVAPLMRVLYGKQLEQIARASNLEEQREIFNKHISGFLWDLMIRVGFSPLSIQIILNDPKYLVEMNVNVGDYLIERLDHTFNNHLVRDNNWTSFMFYGKYLEYEGKRCLPHFLLEENYHAIRQATTKFEIVTTNLIEYMKKIPEHSIDKYSLSDVTSCIDTLTFTSLINEVVRTGADQGKLCYRNFLNKQLIPSDLEDTLQRDNELADALYHDDLAFAYSFEIAQINKTEKQVAKVSTVAGIS
jgi:S-adenosylmethionine-diacylglycerol 3-amino-3-carboxypropyl transferase